jgi:hypothetical protein
MIEKLISPREPYQPYIWYADYGDNNVLTEFEQDGKENKFEINVKIKLKEFGLFGKGLKLFYNVDNGIFTISRNIVKFHIELEDGRIINLYDQYKHYADCHYYLHIYNLCELHRWHTSCQQHILIVLD